MFALVWTVESTTVYEDLKTKALKAKQGREAKKKKRSKQEGLFGQVSKCLSLLAQNPRHPGLQTHEYNSLPNPYNRHEKVFEAYAQNKTPSAYRVFWCYGPQKGQLTIIAITPHP